VPHEQAQTKKPQRHHKLLLVSLHGFDLVSSMPVRGLYDEPTQAVSQRSRPSVGNQASAFHSLHGYVLLLQRLSDETRNIADPAIAVKLNGLLGTTQTRRSPARNIQFISASMISNMLIMHKST
jgi:hypothetical protein